jgi:hypothetical protein
MWSGDFATVAQLAWMLSFSVWQKCFFIAGVFNENN